MLHLHNVWRSRSSASNISALARAPALISEVGHLVGWGGGWGAGAGWGHELERIQPVKESVELALAQTARFQL